MDKVAGSAAAAVAVPHGATLLFGGFGVVQGWPNSLLLALRDHGARDLTVVFNTPGVGPLSAQLLAEAGLVRKVIASFAAYPTRPTPIEEQIKAGKIELELVPQGTLAERVRAGGAALSHTGHAATDMSGFDGEVCVRYEAVYRRAEPACGERRLLLAVLEDGVRTFLKNAGATQGRAFNLRREALAWLTTEDRSDVFAFEKICEALGLDAGRLGPRGLGEGVDGGPPAPPP